jgi:hypothetical protein
MRKRGKKMPIEDLIREHRKFGKRLCGIGFTVSSKGRKIIVKFGKKLNIIECPTIEAAQSLADGFNATIQSRAAQINEFITLMEANCQQLNLFAQPQSKIEAIPSMVLQKGIFMKLTPPEEEPGPVKLLDGSVPVPDEAPEQVLTGPDFFCKGIHFVVDSPDKVYTGKHDKCDFLGREQLCPMIDCARKPKVSEPISSEGEPAPTENPFEGLEEEKALEN